MTVLEEPAALEHALRDRHGRPVPYINLWTGELPETEWQIRYDPDVDGPAICAPKKKRGVGDPDFTKQEPRRQRICTIQHRCQVCAQPAGPAALLVLGSLSVETQLVDGIGRTTLFTEPWLCPDCAKFAVRVCPGLIRRRRAEELFLILPRRTVIVLSKAWLEGPREEQTKRLQPVLWAKVAVTGFDIVEEVPVA